MIPPVTWPKLFAKNELIHTHTHIYIYIRFTNLSDIILVRCLVPIGPRIHQKLDKLSKDNFYPYQFLISNEIYPKVETKVLKRLLNFEEFIQ